MRIDSDHGARRVDSGGRRRPWGGDAGRFTATAVTAVASGRVQVHVSLRTHVVLDVAGYDR